MDTPSAATHRSSRAIRLNHCTLPVSYSCLRFIFLFPCLSLNHPRLNHIPSVVLLLRSARVGKTSLVARFLGGKFEDSYTPTIEDFHRKLYRIRSEIHQLDIVDTSGNHPFPAMRRLSFLTGMYSHLITPLGEWTRQLCYSKSKGIQGHLHSL